MNKTNLLRKALRNTLGAAALLGVSASATAAITVSNLGTLTTGRLSNDGVAPYRSWSDFGATTNFTWGHTSKWYTLQVGDSSQITSGDTLDVQFSLTPRGTTKPLFDSGFAIWTSGNVPVVGGESTTGGPFILSQVRGPNDGTSTADNIGLGTAGGGNIVDGHDGWVGYANAGPSFTNGDGDTVANGGAWNATSPYVLGGGSASGDNDQAILNLTGLKAGYYLVVVGGVCPNGGACNTAPVGGSVRDYTFTASVVPVPAAVWLFGSALAGMGIIGRRKEKLA